MFRSLRFGLWGLGLAVAACGGGSGVGTVNNTNQDAGNGLCGNGQMDPGEECDDGPLNSDTVPDACRTGCRRSYCGDGVTDSMEECDGGPNCDSQCRDIVADQDGDTISDLHEQSDAAVDTDGDGIPDYLDTDSDGDGLSDAEEAGDTDVTTPPVDSDQDGLPDFRDPDSDNDGLSDHREAFELGTDPCDPDTDGDGAFDLVEDLVGTDPLDPLDNPRARGILVFIMPHESTTYPDTDTAAFRTSIQYIDLYFNFDETGSMID
jgi:hypothetical protein